MSNASDFTIENGVLTKYVGPGGTVVIPEGIAEIGNRAFIGNNTIKKLVIPDGVRVIGESAFYCCEKIVDITIPSSVETIEEDAFYGTKLKTITIHAGNLIIKRGSFGFISSVRELTIDGNTVELKGFAFTYTKIKSMKLTVATIKVAPTTFTQDTITALIKSGNVHPKIVSKELMTKAICTIADTYAIDRSSVGYWEEWKNYIKRNASKLLAVAKENENFFHMITTEKLLSVTVAQEWLDTGKFPGSALAVLLEYIGGVDATPQRIDALQIKAPSVTELKKSWAFEKMEDGGLCLTAYKGSDTVVFVPAYIGKAQVTHLRGTFNASFLEVKEPLLHNRSQITEIILPEGLRSIGEKTFYSCGALTEIRIPDQVQEIGAEAFFGCDSLCALDLPDTVTILGEGVFSYMDSLREIKLPKGVRELPRRVFTCCKNLKTVSGLKDIDNIHDGAFRGCDSLTDTNGMMIFRKKLYWVHSSKMQVQVPDGVEAVDPTVYVERQIVAFADHVQCPVTLEGLVTYAQFCKELHFPKTITQIPDAVERYNEYYGEYFSGVFSKNNQLETVIFPEGFMSIGSFAFYKAEKLTVVALPDSVVRLGAHAFEKTGLKTVTIPGKISAIEENAFTGCKMLKKVFVCHGVQMIQKEAFARCSALTEIHIPSSVTDIGEDVFTSKRILKIYAPAGSYAETYAKENNIPFVAE